MSQNEKNNKAIVCGDTYRFTVLTPELIRMEYQENGIFEDRKTQRVVNRVFKVPEYRVKESTDRLEIITESLHLVYDKSVFSSSGLSIQVNGNGSYAKWYYGDVRGNLMGTARTLDGANGAIPLEQGLLARIGFAVLDDSDSIIITEDGWVTAREQKCLDLYFFGYGHAYEKCLKDFYQLTGATPLIPRFALGNWWSRYYPYTQEEYQQLMQRFGEENIPLSVAVIDMDWHLVNIDSKYGNGWTGYTWNEALFPDHKQFMDWLHQHNLKVSLNLHPADGVRGFEKQYMDIAKAMNVDWKNEEPVAFDLTDPKFMKAYFDLICHPHEEDGVDFWWLDWQQGAVSKLPGLDPLWMLNHLHYEDSKRNGKRGLTFSRYAGIGSHRYPIGFSGDTVVTWESLDFQPYFTATASNVGYGWWSHDIGGHMCGYKDEELTSRWIQFGVFSPILRLHSSNNPTIHKEPWFFQQPHRDTICRYLRIRHEMIPYLYSMNVIASRDGQPLIRPMYYLNPEKKEAYNVPNEYYFGTELIACPITQKTDESGMACFDAWLPKGEWVDIFNGRIYNGNRRITLVRNTDDIPVLAKSGAIIPYAVLDKGINGVENPATLRIQIVAGNNGCFHMYEDKEDNDAWTDTVFSLDWENKEFKIEAAQGMCQGIPEARSWNLEFLGITSVFEVEVYIDGEKQLVPVRYDDVCNTAYVEISDVDIHKEVKVLLPQSVQMAQNNIAAQMQKLFAQLNMVMYDDMKDIDTLLKENAPINNVVTLTDSMNMPERAKKAIFEVLLAK